MNEAAQVAANPALGATIFALGGLAGAVFDLPFKRVKGWAWESYWLVYALFGLVVVPWLLALATSPNMLAVLRGAPRGELAYCFLCGAAWGIGGLTWGLMIRSAWVWGSPSGAASAPRQAHSCRRCCWR